MSKISIDYATPPTPQRLPLSGALFLSAGVYVLACIPAVILFEAMGWPQWLIHSSQFFACLLCFGAAIVYLIAAKRDRSRLLGSPVRALALFAVGLIGVYLVLIVILLATFDLSGID
jgi:hypothetical protein